MKREEGSIEYPDAHIPLEGLPFVFINKDMLLKPTDENVHTNFAVAKFLLAHGCVRLIPEEHVFLGSEMNSNKKYTVYLFSKEQCSCKSKTHCHHITACQLALNINIQDTIRRKLGKLIRKQRGLKSCRKGIPKNIILV